MDMTISFAGVDRRPLGPVPEWMDQLFVDGEPIGPPIPDFLSGDNAADLYSALCEPRNVLLPDIVPNAMSAERIYPGHVGYWPLSVHDIADYRKWPNSPRGPSPGCADIVVVGKHPAAFEAHVDGYLFSGPSGAELRRCLADAGHRDFLNRAYFTNLCRFVPPGGKFKATWSKWFEWLLFAELWIIRPKHMLLLGGEAIKHFFGKGSSVSKTRGSAADVEIRAGDQSVTISAYRCTHPAAVARDPTTRPGLIRDLGRFVAMVSGHVSVRTPVHYSVDRSVIRTLDSLRDTVDRLIADGYCKFAVDCEWEGRSPYSGGKLLTVQFSWGIGQAAMVPIHRHPRIPLPSSVADDISLFSSSIPKRYRIGNSTSMIVTPGSDGKSVSILALPDGGICAEATYEVLNQLEPCFSPDDLAGVVEQLRRLLCRDDVRVGGHNFRSDIPWLRRLDLDLTQQYLRGFDTMVKHHVLRETAAHDLTSVMTMHTDMDRYDVEVFEWLSQTGDFSGGFGGIPEAVLYPYALCDVDVVMRCDDVFDREINDLEEPRRSRIIGVIELEMGAAEGILEIEREGLVADRERISQLAVLYADKRDELVTDLRQEIKWPEFNFRSVQQMRELLFGERYNYKGPFDNPIRLRPPGAISCELMPIKSTSKPPKAWAKIMAEGREAENFPSTDKETLGILSDENPIAGKARNLRFVDQVQKTYTGFPISDECDDDVNRDERGLAAYIDDDGRIRTHILQVTETGRWSSSKPNLQNLPSRREPSLHKLFSVRVPKIRSVLMAPPGSLLVSADYAQAELLTLAILSGDENFYRTLTERISLLIAVDESGKTVIWFHPDWIRGVSIRAGDVIEAGSVVGEFRNVGGMEPLVAPCRCFVRESQWDRDLHAEVAISNFRLPYCAVLHGPPKRWTDKHYADRRISAKTVNFGIPYGRQAGAISREIRQDGVFIEDDETQSIIDHWHNSYALCSEFLDRCAYCATRVGYMINPFGRYRRFTMDLDRVQMAAQEREASNFPIQSTVADALNRAVRNFVTVRRHLQSVNVPSNFALVLAVHDSTMARSDVATLPFMVMKYGIIDTCMSTMAKIPCPDRHECDGLYSRAIPDMFPFALKTDKKISIRWDEEPDADQLLSMGVPEYLIKRSR